MQLRARRLPSRFPVGTRYVVEGRRGPGGLSIRSRYLEFPDGRHMELPPQRIRRSRSRQHQRLG
jgi:hypothetical protein